jgi:hypothetical protein
MYLLKRVALKQGRVPRSHKSPDLYQAFTKEVERHGRITGSILMTRYGMRHPEDMLNKVSLGIKLLKRKRLEYPPQRTKHPENIANLLRREGWKDQQ